MGFTRRRLGPRTALSEGGHYWKLSLFFAVSPRRAFRLSFPKQCGDDVCLGDDRVSVGFLFPPYFPALSLSDGSNHGRARGVRRRLSPIPLGRRPGTDDSLKRGYPRTGTSSNRIN